MGIGDIPQQPEPPSIEDKGPDDALRHIVGQGHASERREMVQGSFKGREPVQEHEAAKDGSGHGEVAQVQDGKPQHDLPGIHVLKSADLLLISMRRRTLASDQLQLFRDYVAAGKPVMGIRTANHAFCLRNQPAPEGFADWPEFDRDVIGGSYTNHYGNGPKTSVTLAEGTSSDHRILKGVDLAQLIGNGSLYKVAPLQPSASALLMGSIPDNPAEPIAFLNKRTDGGTTFYTSFGHIDDFKEPAFKQMLVNTARWLTHKHQ